MFDECRACDGRVAVSGDVERRDTGVRKASGLTRSDREREPRTRNAEETPSTKPERVRGRDGRRVGAALVSRSLGEGVKALAARVAGATVSAWRCAVEHFDACGVPLPRLALLSARARNPPTAKLRVRGHVLQCEICVSARASREQKVHARVEARDTKARRGRARRVGS